MKLVAFLVCDSLNQCSDGRLNMLGAGLDRIFPPPPKYPWNVNLALLCRVEVSPAEGGEHEFSLRFMSEDGKDVLPVIPRRIEIDATRPYFNFNINLNNIPIPSAGRFSLTILVDKQDIGASQYFMAPEPQENAPHSG